MEDLAFLFGKKCADDLVGHFRNHAVIGGLAVDFFQGRMQRTGYSDAFGTHTPAVTFAPERSARSHNTEKNVPESV